MPDIQQRRNQLNLAILVVPVQWFTLMVVYWMRFLPPLRPFAFSTPAPSMAVLVSGIAASCVPFLLPAGYFLPRSFERGHFYPRLGLRWFRYIAPDGDLVNRRLRREQPSYRVVFDRDSLQKHLEGTYSNECWHSSFFIAGAGTILHALTTAQFVFAAFLMVTNLVFNLFPVMHQRYKRARLRRFMERESVR